MAFVGLLTALVSVKAAFARDCSNIGNCGSCVDHTFLGAHTCYWCEIDAGCHAVGSLVSPCTPTAANDFCISKSSLSTCSKDSTLECAAMLTTPRQIHLSHCGSDCMRVSWKTNGHLPKSMHVLISHDFSHDNGTTVPVERSVQYLPSQGGHGYHHAARLSHLRPGTTYQYRIVADGATSTARSFKTLATKQTDATFLLIADMGYKEQGQAMESRHRIEKLKGDSDMVIHAGDIGYADDSFLHGLCSTEFCYESVYDGYMEWIENISDAVPYMVSPGNHESECHSPACQVSSDIKHSLSNFSAFNARWNMPSKESGGVANMWYSFDYASVHWVSINTETDFAGAAEENYGDAGGVFGQPSGHFASDGAYLAWLEADLRKANSNRAERPWIIAFGHRPWFLFSGKSVAKATRDAHASLFEKYGVDLYINGHIHSYHRLLPVNQNRNTPTVTVGGAGCDEFLSDRLQSGRFDQKGRNDNWDFRYYNLDKIVAQMKVSPTKIIFSTYASTDGDVIDTFSLTKSNHQDTFV